MMKLLCLALAAVVTARAFAQAGAPSRRIIAGSALPATCVSSVLIKDWFWKNGDGLYVCTSPDTWAPGSSGGATPAGSGSELQARSGATSFLAITGSSVSGANITLGGTLTIPNGANKVLNGSGDTFGFSPTNHGPLFFSSVSGFAFGLDSSALTATRILTVPDAADTLVGRATTDTLTNKTLTTPTISSFINATHSHTAAAGGGQITDGALSAAVSTSKGGTGQTSATDDTVAVYNGTGTDLKAIPNCTDSAGNHLNYTTATNTISCGTSSSSSGVTGTGTLNVIPKVTNATGPVVGDSGLSEVSGQLRYGAATTADANTDVLIAASSTTKVPVTIETIASQTASPFQIKNSAGTVFARFGMPGTNSSPIPLLNPGIELVNGVDTLGFSADGQFHSTITATNTMILATGAGIWIQGPGIGTATVVGNPNGQNHDRRSIMFGRHAGQTGQSPTVQGPVTIGVEAQTNSDPVFPLVISGGAADPSGSTNLVGGAVTIAAGAGASGSGGLATGGAVNIDGGTGFGTGAPGSINLGVTRGAVVVGAAGLSTTGWLGDIGHAFLAADGTTTSATLATTGLSITVTSGRKYSFVCELFLSDSVAADGAVIDFAGGAATSTNFRAQVTAFDTALNLSTQLTSLAGTATATTFTGAGAFEVHGSFEPSSTGTWIPRYAQANHTTGTLTIARGSYCKMWDMY